MEFASFPREYWRRVDAFGNRAQSQRPAPSIVDAAQALDRAIRRKLAGPNTGVLPDDLAAAVIEAASELLDGEDECTVAELNELFGLALSEPAESVPLDDPQEAIEEIVGNLYGDDLLDLLGTVASDWSVLASTPQGAASMMSDSGICLCEFTVDDRVYFFILAEPDVCDANWWFAHDVGDLDSRARSIEGWRGSFALTEDDDD
jgi:hypothetical protein